VLLETSWGTLWELDGNTFGTRGKNLKILDIKTSRTLSEATPFGGSHNYKTKQNKWLTTRGSIQKIRYDI